MSKKKRWFQKGSWTGNEINPSLFGNTIKKHQEKLKKNGRVFDEDGYEILPEDEYSYSSYNWEWDSKLLNNENKGTDKKEKYEFTKSEYDNKYNSYEKTGYWGGYTRMPQLTYKYVQQMANALSAQHNIKVQIGNDWKVDLINKELTYNPASLIYGTKAELLATLMHEIGKLRYVTHHTLLKNKYITMYKNPALEVLSIYEDLRTDFKMLQAYESASEIYESIVPTIEKQVEGYMKYGSAFRDLVWRVTDYQLKKVLQEYCDQAQSHVVNPSDPKLKEALFKVFGTSDLAGVNIQMAVLKANCENNGSIYEYCGEMLAMMYDLDEQGHKRFENIQECVDKTIDTIDPSKKETDSQSLLDYLDGTTYPVVEHLMKDASDKNDQIKKAFPDMADQIVKQIMDQVQAEMNVQGQVGNIDSQGNTKTRTSRTSNSTIPPEWQSGDYKTLKDSVSMEIKQLVNKLTFLRREELTVRYTTEQKRGKLYAKNLYKSTFGSTRLFKRKLENLDTIRSFAFSLLIDVSGSMNGERITHTTRAMIVLIEVFKQMQIPFEVVTYDDGAKTVKAFTAEMDKKIEAKIGGLPQHSGGGTNLHNGLEALKLKDQPEKNKVCIVLTDGGVGDTKYYDDKYFIPWAKKGIKSVGFGIECESQMRDLCMGNSRLLDNASQLPVEFSKLLKSLIKR